MAKQGGASVKVGALWTRILMIMREIYKGRFPEVFFLYGGVDGKIGAQRMELEA